jgi:hypothetical protein
MKERRLERRVEPTLPGPSSIVLVGNFGQDGEARRVRADCPKFAIGGPFHGLSLTRAGSRPDHAFPETDGSERKREETRTAPFEFTRALEEPAGHLRTPHQDGSGPCVRRHASDSQHDSQLGGRLRPSAEDHGI